MPGGDFGILHLSTEDVLTGSRPEMWSDCTVNTVFLAVSVFLVIAICSGLISLLPDLRQCLFHPHGAAAFEHSLHKSRDRDAFAVCLAFPAVVVMDRFGLYSPSFLEDIPVCWRVPLMCGVLLLYYLLKIAMAGLPGRLRLRGDEKNALRNNIFSAFVLLMTACLPITCIMVGAGASDALVRQFWLLVSGFAFLVVIYRDGQILHSHCGLFSTFLYLCGLEFVPAAFLVLTSWLL